MKKLANETKDLIKSLEKMKSVLEEFDCGDTGCTIRDVHDCISALRCVHGVSGK